MSTVTGRIIVGPVWNASFTQLSSALNTATTYLGYSVQQNATKTIQTVEIYVSAVAGTLTNISCELQADSSGSPSGTALETVTVTSGLPTGAGAFTFTFAGTTSMTYGSLYWLVFKNNTPTQASNNYTIQHVHSIWRGFSGETTTTDGGFQRSLTTDGSTWTGRAANSAGFLIGYTDSTYDGIALNNVTSDSTNLVYGTQEVGIQFTAPSQVGYNVVGIGMSLTRNGSPTGNLAAKLWTGGGGASAPSLLATTQSLAPGQLTNVNYYIFLFSSPQVLSPGVVVTVTMNNSAADSSSNCYKAVGWVPFDTSSGSKSTWPFQGTVLEIINNNGTWSTSTGLLPEICLLLDSSTPFTSAGGSTVPAPIEVPTYSWR